MRFYHFFLLLSVFSIFPAVFTPVHAQFSIGMRVSPSIPFGSFQQRANFGGGVTLEGNYTSKSRYNLGLSFGYHQFSSGQEGYSFGINPLTLSAEYMLKYPEGFTPYVGVEAGLYTFSERVRGLTVNDSFAGFSPAVGFLYPLSTQLWFNGRVQYAILLTDEEALSFMPISLGLRFTFSEYEKSPKSGL